MNELEKLFSEIFTEDFRPQTYPPYNISMVDKDHTMIEVAVAGFRHEELELEKDGLKLTLTGTKSDAFRKQRESYDVRHNGLAFRDFSHSWKLKGEVVVVSSLLENGVLRIILQLKTVREEPKKLHIDKM